MSRRKKSSIFDNSPAAVEYRLHASRMAQPGNRLAAQYLLSLLAFAVLTGLILLGIENLGFQLLFAAVVLFIPWHHSAAILFFLVQASLFIHEGPNGIANTAYNPLIISVVGLVFITCADRFRTSWTVLGDSSVKGLWTSILSIGERATENKTAAAMETDLSDYTPTAMIPRLLRMITFAIIAVLVSGLILTVFPESQSSRKDIRLQPHELRAITIGIFVLLVGIIGSHILSLIFWRSLTPGQARIYLRSAISNWLAPDSRGIVKRQQKLRKKSQQK